MPKTIPSNVATEMELESNYPIHLVKIELADTTLYFASSSIDINFPTAGGNTYVSWGFDFSRVKSTLNLETDRVQFRFDNTDLTFSTSYLIDNKFQGRRLTLYKVMDNLLASAANAVVLFSGKMGAPKSYDKVDESSTMIMVLSDFNSFRSRFPPRQYSKPCSWEFDGPKCRGTEDLTNGDMELNANWAAFGTPTTEEQSTEEVYKGTYSWKVVTDSEPEGITNAAVVAPTIGNTYKIETWVKILAIAGAGSEDVVLFWDDAVLDSTATTGEWLLLEAERVYGGGDDNIYVYTRNSTSSTFHVDEASIRLVLADPKTDGAAESGSTTTQILDDANRNEADDYWNNGKITFTSGNNSGLIRQINDFTSSTGAIDIIIAFPNAIGIGDTYDIERGCDKNGSTCRLDFDNWINNGGFAVFPRKE